MMNTHIATNSRWPSAAQWAIEAVAGAAVGLALGAICGFAAARLFAGSASGWGDLVGAILGSLIGYTIGVSIGVYQAGTRLGRRGSYWLALAGSIGGAALALLAAEPLRLNANPAVLQIALASAAAILSTVGFNLDFRFRK
jgi:hypothetical protein